MPSFNTETTLVILYYDLCWERVRSSVSLLILLDISVAFDTIHHGMPLGSLSLE